MFAVKKIASLLLGLKLIGWPGSLYPKATKNQAIYKVFFPASIVAIYFALIEDKCGFTDPGHVA